jgi:hypothetical protein
LNLQFVVKVNRVPVTPQETLSSQILHPDSRVSPRIVPAGERGLEKRGGRKNSHKSRETDLPRNRRRWRDVLLARHSFKREPHRSRSPLHTSSENTSLLHERDQDRGIILLGTWNARDRVYLPWLNTCFKTRRSASDVLLSGLEASPIRSSTPRRHRPKLRTRNHPGHRNSSPLNTLRAEPTYTPLHCTIKRSTAPERVSEQQRLDNNLTSLPSRRHPISNKSNRTTDSYVRNNPFRKL